MAAIKRDRGEVISGALIESRGGILSRIDAICFAAPVFFHVTRYFFGTTLMRVVLAAMAFSRFPSLREPTALAAGESKKRHDLINPKLARWALGHRMNSRLTCGPTGSSCRDCISTMHPTDSDRGRRNVALAFLVDLLFEIHLVALQVAGWLLLGAHRK